MIALQGARRRYLDGGGVVELEGLGLAILQVDLQNVGQEQKRVSLENSKNKDRTLERSEEHVPPRTLRFHTELFLAPSRCFL